jgi:hypothetical protein
MNREQINAFRTAHGLDPMPPKATNKRNQNANRAARAQANRDMKAARGTRSKAK